MGRNRVIGMNLDELTETRRLVDKCGRNGLSDHRARQLVHMAEAYLALRAAAEPEAKDEVTCHACGNIGPPSKPGDPFIHQKDCPAWAREGSR